MYLLFEGVDGVGKSTQIQLLKSSLRDVVVTKEPGGTDLGVTVRKMLLQSDDAYADLSELFLFLADRAEHFEKIVKPALEAKKIVISDRGFLSGMGYALTRCDVDEALLYEINMLALQGRAPDLVFFFYLPFEELERRHYAKSHDKIEKRGIKYLFDVQQKMYEILQDLKIKHILIDATESKEHIASEIIKSF